MCRFNSAILIILLCLASIESKGQLIIEETKAEGYDLYSKWQSLNNRNLVIEFIKPDKYVVYNDQEEFLNFSFQIESIEDGVFNIILLVDENDQEPGKASIQIVNDNRIRIYVWKHGTVLQTADEYYRTEDLESFPRHIKTVMNEGK